MMKEGFIGLHIRSGSIAAVKASRTLRGLKVTDRDLIALSDAGGLAEALRSLFSKPAYRRGSVRIALPGRWFSFRTLRLPFEDRRRIDKTIGFEMESRIPFTKEDVLIDYLRIKAGDQSQIFAAAIQKKRIENLLAALRECGVEPAVIDIGPVPMAARLLENRQGNGGSVIVDLDGDDATVILSEGNAIVMIRSMTRGSTEAMVQEVLNTLRSALVRGIVREEPRRFCLIGPGAGEEEATALGHALNLPLEKTDFLWPESLDWSHDLNSWDSDVMDTALSLAMGGRTQDLGFNFAVGDFRPRRKFQKIQREALWTGAVVCVVCAAFGADFLIKYRTDRLRLARMKGDITAVFHQAMPQATTIVDPLQQLKIKVDELRKKQTAAQDGRRAPTVLDILKSLSANLPPAAAVTFTNFSLSAGSLELRGETDSFNTVDAVKIGCAGAGLFRKVVINSATILGKGPRVAFSISMEVAAP
ncbi:MAG: pilus assembly protein PilM [Deltaproteobacteria bacterium]|nr:pilus assembly protein PilM [Deltaproteobacteria bacterium]